ncbi:methyltransferase [Labrenzia sp. PHM005]|uniref:class I SAM-dependent methyltransferase n=1 Tax=Labrenzia sp. PHM005 TaxID=2590016 RepID=UPI0011400D37|nr:50S ribosomal protein L11 methyltransferase [Labrenzia sp. PHM005]QDG75556.1 methyltransferase [Labrenzia sp. PHM005]
MPRIENPRQFIVTETRIRPVPHAEEISLYVADEAMGLWQKTEEELGELGLEPPFWAFAWAGGQGLARYILDHPELVAGKRVVDFACGSGLVGIAAMMAGAGACHAVDVDPFAIAAAELNAELNGVSLTFEEGDITSLPAPDADVVFCGDVFYDQQMAKRVLRFIDTLLAQGLDVYVGDPGRTYLPHERLVELASYQVSVVGQLEDNEIKSTRVYRIAEKPS